MNRFFVTPEQWVAGPCLADEEAHHCVRVMRHRDGDEVIIFDGQGRSSLARIRSADRKEVALEVLEDYETQSPKLEIELAVGIPKGKTMDLIVQKAVELGVSRIQPLMTDQGNVRFDEKEALKKAEKWQRLALEACKQCGQNILPKVKSPMSLGPWLTSRSPADREIVAALTDQSKPLKSVLSTGAKFQKITLLIGPEGDFSASEYGKILKTSFLPVSLGDLVLKVETAAFYLIGAVLYVAS